MAQSFKTYWPSTVELMSYTQKDQVISGATVLLLQRIPGWAAFHNRWRYVPEARGLPGPKRPFSLWAKQGYDFHWDAVKWARQAFIPWDAATRMGEGILVWFDGDTYTHNTVPDYFLANLMNGADVAYLGRGAIYSEIGFQGYRLPEALPFLNAWRDLYSTGEFWRLPEWHSAYTWDVCRRSSPLRFKDLAEGRPMDGSGNIWHQSPLDLYTKHLKGAAKLAK